MLVGSKKQIRDLESQVINLKLTINELNDIVDSLEAEIARKNKQIAMMEKMMKLDQVRRNIK